jgi:prepilin-type N-terminal cleavage/methylation domain-containing protein
MKISIQTGFTIVELMIVLAIIAIMLAIAIPNYTKSREESHRNSCIVNLRQINSAIDQWVIENKIATGTVPSGADEDEIYAYLKGAKPKCPSGGIYTIHAVGDIDQVTCSLTDRGHTL